MKHAKIRMNMIEYHYIISGRVQGVGFRYFVKEKAQNLGMKGRVQNTYDGKVEVLAQSKDEKIFAEFEDWLKIGPSMGRVEKIKKEKNENIIEKFKDFQIN
jgi:acylphosphatase